jgi:ketosteroid isomerase-like protein
VEASRLNYCSSIAKELQMIAMSFACRVGAVLIAAIGAAQAASVPEPGLAEAQLRAINHRDVSAFAIGDGEFMQALTAENFLLLGAAGEWTTRAEHMRQMQAPSMPQGVSYDDVRVRLFGAVALVHGYFEGLGENRTVLRVRYTDAYERDGARWRLIHAQNTMLKPDVAKAQQQGDTPAHKPWRSSDPVGDDLDVLRVLNENYVRSFRESDVAWYDAHLAPDYVAIYGDGSFHDRASALQDFAKPVFQTHMRRFPVGKVRIRRFGDIAFIHAENAYETKDGRQGVSRYTDIWRKLADGRWQCVAAHITAHRAPS